MPPRKLTHPTDYTTVQVTVATRNWLNVCAGQYPEYFKNVEKLIEWMLGNTCDIYRNMPTKEQSNPLPGKETEDEQR